MTLPDSINVALKEWSSTITALETGRQIILLRKGGILEQSVKNRFSITHNEFLFLPTYLHQSRAQLKPEIKFEAMSAEPESIKITSAGLVTDILKVSLREQIDRLDDLHIWTPVLIDMRFNYKPQNPLYLVLVRTYRLHKPTILVNTPALAGCKSWVPLPSAVETQNVSPVLDDEQYARQRHILIEKLSG